jgi:putative methionine-R-sulfoxide reductase with GAF domain
MTEAFAAQSNNSTVAMTKTAVIIPDVDALAGDEPYYSCSSHVRWELCAPLVSASGDVVGIVDIEAWRPNAATSEQVDAVLRACAVLAERNVGRR